MAQLVFPSPEAATINVGGTLYPASILVERKYDEKGSTKEVEEERIDNLQRVVLNLVAAIEDLKTASETAKEEMKNLKEKIVQSERVPSSSNDLVEAATHELEDSFYREFEDEYDDDSEEEYDSSEDAKIEEVKDNEEPVAMKDVLRLIEHSAKAIDYMNEHQFSTVWSPCSCNTYGFFIRNVLLCGSSFKHQLIPASVELMAISILGVVFAAGMQFILAWYLWVNLPPIYPLVNGNGAVLKPYPGASQTDENGSYVSGRGYFEAKNGFCVTPDCLTAPLPSYQFPDYSAANDVCRTQSIVQIICIGLFLFSVLTNVPGIIKNVLIILWSERFISEDEQNITKIHFWRESDFSREPQDDFLNQPQTSANYSSAGSATARIVQARRLCDFFRTVKYKDPSEGQLAKPLYLRSSMLDKFYLPLSDFGKPGIVKWVESVGGSFAGCLGLCVSKAARKKDGPLDLTGLPRSFFEIADTRQFLSEILQDLSYENREVKDFGEKDEDKAKKTEDKDDKAKNAKDLPYAERVKFNLVRADYLKPVWTRPFAYNYLRMRKKEAEKRKAAAEEEAARLAAQKQRGQHSVPPVAPDGGDEGAQAKQLESQIQGLKELKDRESVENLYTNYPARMRRFRIMAFLFGVIPEIISLMVVTFAGVQYILWSGFKIGSDSRGMEEIILATLAICFVYDIDDTLYAHVLPEFYKTAHERDKFELRGWISSSVPSSVAEAQSLSFFWKILSFQTRYVFSSLFPNSVRKPRLDMISILTSDQKQIRKGDMEGKELEMKAVTGALKRAPRLRRGIPAFDAKDAAETANKSEDYYCDEEKKNRREKADKVLETEAAKMMKDFETTMLISATRAMKMSGDSKYHDFYLARQYPFFYARKFHTHFTGHLGESFLVWYGHLGLHFLILLALALSIVGAYRTAARCNRYTPSSSIWSTQEWPSTCVMNVASQPAADFKNLRGRDASLLVPVSCGLSGYLPSEAEWKANEDFFLDKRR